MGYIMHGARSRDGALVTVITREENVKADYYRMKFSGISDLCKFLSNDNHSIGYITFNDKDAAAELLNNVSFLEVLNNTHPQWNIARLGFWTTIKPEMFRYVQPIFSNYYLVHSVLNDEQRTAV